MRMTHDTHLDGVFEPLSRASSTFFRHEPIVLPSSVPGCPDSRRADMIRSLNAVNVIRRNTYLRAQGILIDFGPLKELIATNDSSLLTRVMNPDPVDGMDTSSKADTLLFHWIHAQRFLRR